MSAGSIIIDLLMRTGSFVTDTGKAEKSLKQFKREAKATGTEVLGMANSFLGLVGITLSVGGIAALINSAIKGAAAFKDLSEMTGTSAEDLAALSVAAAVAGVPIDAVGASINKLTKNLVGVDDESKAAGAALVALGINVADFKKLNPADQYEALGKALNKFSDEGTSGGAKVAVAMTTMGKSGAEQLKVFKALEEQGERTVILTQKQIEAADNFSDRLAHNMQVVKLTAQAYATNLLPAFEEVISAIGTFSRDLTGIQNGLDAFATNKSIREWADEQALGIGRLLGKVQALVLLTKAIEGGNPLPVLGKAFERMRAGESFRVDDKDGPLGRWRAFFEFDSDTYEKQLNDARKARNALALDNLGPKLGGDKPGLVYDGAEGKGKGAKAAQDAMDKQRADLASYIKSLSDEVEALGKVGEAQKALNKLMEIGSIGAVPQVKALVLMLVQQAEALRDIKAQEEDIIALRKLEVSATRDLDDEIDKLSGRADQRRKDAMMARLDFQRSSGITYTDEELVSIIKGIHGIGDATEHTTDIAKELGLTFSSAFEDALVEGGKLSDVLKGLEKDIIRIMARKLVTEPIGNAVSGWLKDAGVNSMGSSGGGGSSFLSSIGSMVGAWFGGGSSSVPSYGAGSGWTNVLGGRAGGGNVDAGGLYRVNERGRPEMLTIDGRDFLMMGNRRGWVDPNPSAQSTSRSTTINAPITITMPPGTSAATGAQLGAQISRRLQVAHARNA